MEIGSSSPTILVETEEDYWKNKFYELKTRHSALKRESRERASKARKLILATAIKLQEKENEIQKLRDKHDHELSGICRELTLLQSRMLFERRRISDLLTERALNRLPPSSPSSNSALHRSGSFRQFKKTEEHQDKTRPPLRQSLSVPSSSQKSILKTSSSHRRQKEGKEEDDILPDESSSILESLKRTMKIEESKDSGRESDESLILQRSCSASSSPNSSFDSNDSSSVYRKVKPPPPPRSIHTKLTTVSPSPSSSLRRVQFSISSSEEIRLKSTTESVSYFEPYL